MPAPVSLLRILFIMTVVWVAFPVGLRAGPTAGNIRLVGQADISDPANFELILALDREMLGIGNHIPHNPVIVGDLLFVSWYENGLQVFDIGDPAMPVRIARLVGSVGRVCGWDIAGGSGIATCFFDCCERR